MKVLVTSAGSVNGVNVIQTLLNKKYHKSAIEVHAADCDKNSAGLLIADKSVVFPKVKEPSFKSTLLQYCKVNTIDVVIPTYSEELAFFSNNQEELQVEGLKFLVSNPRAIEISNSKWKMVDLFKEHSLYQPRVFNYGHQLKHINYMDFFPLFMKSAQGSGSKYAHKVEDYDSLVYYLTTIPDPIVQEYIGGEEYTISVFRTEANTWVLPIERLKVRGGMSVVCQSVKLSDDLVESIKALASSLDIKGVANFQVKIVEGRPYFIEFNCRFPCGTYPCAIESGMNYPMMILDALYNNTSSVTLKYGVKIVRYWNYCIESEGE